MSQQTIELEQDIHQRVAGNLRAIRVHQGRSQDEFAGIFGLRRSVYSGYETGAVRVPIALLHRVQQHFQIGADVLLGQDLLRTDSFKLGALLRGSHRPRSITASL